MLEFQAKKKLLNELVGICGGKWIDNVSEGRNLKIVYQFLFSDSAEFSSVLKNDR